MHNIQKGDTLSGLAIKYGVRIEDIKYANKLLSNDLGIFLVHFSKN